MLLRETRQPRSSALSAPVAPTNAAAGIAACGLRLLPLMIAAIPSAGSSLRSLLLQHSKGYRLWLSAIVGLHHCVPAKKSQQQNSCGHRSHKKIIGHNKKILLVLAKKRIATADRSKKNLASSSKKSYALQKKLSPVPIEMIQGHLVPRLVSAIAASRSAGSSTGD